MSFVENSLVVPSPIGVPVTLNITLVHMTSVTGQFKVEGVQSHIQSLITGSSLSGVPLKVEMKTDIRYSFLSQLMIQFLEVQNFMILCLQYSN